MSSLRKIEANRANGAKSKGPISIDGKHRVSQNALKHGLTAVKHQVLANESLPAFQAFLQEVTDEYQPQTSTQRQLVWDIAHLRWRLSRFATLECAILDVRMDRQQEEVDKSFAHPDEAARTAIAWCAEAGASAGLALLSYYENRLHRAWHRSVSALRELQSK